MNGLILKDPIHTIVSVKDRKHVSLVLLNSGTIQIRMPVTHQSGDLRLYLEKHEEWIRRSKSELYNARQTDPGQLIHPNVPYRILFMADDSPIPYSIIISNRKKSITLQVQPDKRLIVTVPGKYDLEYIENCIGIKRNWILKKLSFFDTIPVVSERRYCQGEPFFYLGQQYLLEINESESIDAAGVMIQNNRIVVIIPHHPDPDKSHTIIKKLLLSWYQNQLAPVFYGYIQQYSTNLNLPMPDLRYRLVIRKWGSYSLKKHEILCNISLMMAPLPEIEYVAAHEVCHILHQNHSKAFWGVLQGLMPDYQKRRKELQRWQYACRF